MLTTAGPGDQRSRVVVAMGLKQGDLVEELGWDTDVDETLREAVMDAVDAEMVDEPIDAVGVVLLWWREEDGDLADVLINTLPDLDEGGSVWLLTPKVGRDGYVDPADIKEATVTAGLALANAASVSEDWQAQKIVRPKHSRR